LHLSTCCLLALALHGLSGQAPRTQLIAWGQMGGQGLPPENSLPAIENAYSGLGFDGVEMDILYTKDSELVLLHDHTLDRTTDGSGLVWDYTFAELQQFSLGVWEGAPVRIPRLADTLRVNGARGLFLADMRVHPVVSVPRLGEALRETQFDEGLLAISAYSIPIAQEFKRAFPNARVVLKSYVYPKDVSAELVAAVATAGLDGLMLQVPNDGEPIQPFVDELHARGLTLTLFVHWVR
jgi:glycerophosphoryl diester phosphodiesterase